MICESYGIECGGCESGYYVNSNKTCSSCIANCASRKNPGTTCIACNNNYHLTINETCVKDKFHSALTDDSINYL